MNDIDIDIPPLGMKDRRNLNVGSHLKSNKKPLIIAAFLAVVVLVVIFAVTMAAAVLEESLKQEPVVEVESNHMAGKEHSVVDESSSSWLEELRRQKAKDEEKKQAEALAAEKEANSPTVQPPPAKPKPSAQPAPQVQPSQPRVTRRPDSYRESPPPKPEPNRKLSATVTYQATQDAMNVANSVLNEPQYDTSFNSSRFAKGTASARPRGSLDYLLKHGSVIPCAIYTQIISTHSGYVTCRVTQDVYSANGATLLVEKGSLASGVQNVAMEQGQARIFTTWADIETPQGIMIQIDSLGTGALGAAGIDAWVDNHFAERFGGAIMLSFVDDALATLSSQLSKKNNVSVDNSTQNASDMASKALESSINIPPTGYAYIGQRINILIARDIDMSSVYQLVEDEYEYEEYYE
ncbi:type IV secretion system protein VirB10 [Vibrio cholerae]|uniref:TrbI/VirB10 family protein n=1 Tax=Vibrio cholerae TaxID=666 RepID=A0ABD7SU57_VIBCL|nr:type IV secretion system protein VirB10 [Vibrio cholerae]EKF9578249.1 type IV secretion system protein VirB10 [Vibrio cholerae]ELP1740272.1 type IV secretion system protein VirB10 [Vibrio cholerae]MBS3661075.1 type IV secretion system protein VirB10 [Vibrio cholerae]MCX9667466.1 type IV secretion system protein VirB10 [Vibrio cholerae]MDD9696495.1 type IV secretion system protein VirB10 [Vibrio cholerae]